MRRVERNDTRTGAGCKEGVAAIERYALSDPEGSTSRRVGITP